MDLKIVSPILGFDAIKSMTLKQIDEYFSTLESDGVSFTLIDPTKIREYNISIPTSYAKLLDIDDGDKIDIYCIVIIQKPIEKSFVNFVAPIIVNSTKKLLLQVALDDKEYEQFGLSEPISNYL